MKLRSSPLVSEDRFDFCERDIEQVLNTSRWQTIRHERHLQDSGERVDCSVRLTTIVPTVLDACVGGFLSSLTCCCISM